MSASRSSGSEFDELARELVRRLGAAPARVLYLSRNDVEPGRALEAAWPSAKITIRTKADFQGQGFLKILGHLRREPADLFLIHDRPAVMDSLADLYRLAAFGARARRRFLLSADVRRGSLAGPWTLVEVHLATDLPALGLRLAREAFAGGWAIARAAVSIGAGPKRSLAGRALSRPAGSHWRIAYLRSDLAFVGLEAGGSVSHTLGVIGGLVEAGHAVDVLAADPVPGLDRSRVVETVIPPGRAVRVFDEAAMVAYHHRFVAEAARVLRTRRPDALYQRHAVFNATGAVLARKLGLPLILEANHTEVGAKAMWSRLQMPKLARKMERMAFETADAIVAVSSIGADALVGAGADRARILVNPNGVDPERFRPDIDGRPVRSRFGFHDDEVVCGFLGTFTRWHGVVFLADQVPALVARHPRIRFLFMGDGDLRSAVEDRLKLAGVRTAACFTGLIPHAAVPEHLAACDVFISPHLPFEDGTPFFGSPTKLFEYMAMGRAIVASDLGQIGEVIENGKSGMLYGPGRAEELHDRLNRVVADASLREALGREARRRVVAEYTWKRNAERAVAFLNDRLSRG